MSEIPKYISPSQAAMWLRCQAQWKYRYVDGLKSPPSAALAFGKAFDNMSNAVYSLKMVTGETANDTADLFAAEWDKAKVQVELWEDEDPAKLLDQGTTLATLWRNDIAVTVQPVGVQVPANLIADDGTQIHGIVDTVAQVGDNHKVVHELKTKAKSMSEADIQRSLQVPIYAEAVGTNQVQWDVAVKTKVPKTQVIQTTVTPRDVRGAVSQLVGARRQINASVQSGDFLPNRQNMMCSKRWCAYWEQCEKDHGGTVPS